LLGEERRARTEGSNKSPLIGLKEGDGLGGEKSTLVLLEQSYTALVKNQHGVGEVYLPLFRAPELEGAAYEDKVMQRWGLSVFGERLGFWDWVLREKR
jgi:hypothetical protein